MCIPRSIAAGLSAGALGVAMATAPGLISSEGHHSGPPASYAVAAGPPQSIIGDGEQRVVTNGLLHSD